MSQENQIPIDCQLTNRCTNRLATFKHKGKDVEEMRRRRGAAYVELRKTCRFNQMLKKRNISAEDQSSPLQITNSFTQGQISRTIPKIMEAIKSDDENLVFEAVQDARKILSREKNPPIQDIINSGIVPHLVEFLSPKYSENFQFEACWALTNIASGNSEETGVIIKAGALPKLVALLDSPNKNIAEQACWALGNIAGDGPSYRDQVINMNALPAFLKLLDSDIKISTTRNVVWAISNLCRNKNPPPPFEVVKTCLPALRKMLYSTDNDVLADTCWSLSYLTDGPGHRIQVSIDAGIVPRVVELLSFNNTADNCLVLTPALRTVGNIVTGNDKQTDCVINAGALPKLKVLLTADKLNIVKEAAWTISNITAGNPQQIQAVIDAGILPPLIQVLETGDFKSQKEAAWAVTNFTSGATIQQLSYLLQLGVLTPLCNLLSAKDCKTVLVVLDALFNILINAEKVGELYQITVLIEECGGVDKLEILQSHENEEVYEKALNIIDKFFSSEDNEENVAPEEMNGQFNFKPMEQPGYFNF